MNCAPDEDIPNRNPFVRREMLSVSEWRHRAETAEALVRDYAQSQESHKALVRELDGLLNDGDAAKQASLCDLVAQVHQRKREGCQLLTEGPSESQLVDMVVAYTGAPAEAFGYSLELHVAAMRRALAALTG